MFPMIGILLLLLALATNGVEGVRQMQLADIWSEQDPLPDKTSGTTRKASTNAPTASASLASTATTRTAAGTTTTTSTTTKTARANSIATAATANTTANVSTTAATNSTGTYLKQLSFSLRPTGQGEDIRKGAMGKYIYPAYQWTSDPTQAIRGFAFVKTASPLKKPSPPLGYTRIEQDLNDGAASTYNYLCVTTLPRVGPPIREMTFFKLTQPLKEKTYQGWTVFQQNLIEGFTGLYVYLGYKV